VIYFGFAFPLFSFVSLKENLGKETETEIYFNLDVTKIPVKSGKIAHQILCHLSDFFFLHIHSAYIL
jgi:hypothetical protein